MSGENFLVLIFSKQATCLAVRRLPFKMVNFLLKTALQTFRMA